MKIAVVLGLALSAMAAVAVQGCILSFSTGEETSSCDEPCPCTLADYVNGAEKAGAAAAKHCIRVQGCTTHDDCPTGTMCVESLAGGALPEAVLACATPGGSVCVLDVEFGEHKLVEGFSVPEFPITQIDGTRPASVMFTPPEGTEFIACAMFGCAPSFRAREDDPARIEIADWDRCVVSNTPSDDPLVVTAEQTTFTPIVPRVAVNACSFTDSDGAAPLHLGDRRRQITGLGIGCWAYDSVRIIGATRILSIPADQMSDYPTLVQVCTEGDDWACVLEAGPPAVFGTCRSGECRPRCVTAGDCSAYLAAASKSCPFPRPTCDHTAPLGESDDGAHYVGLCGHACDKPRPRWAR